MRNKAPTAKTAVIALLALALSACAGNTVSQPADSERAATLTVQWRAGIGTMTPLLRPVITADGTRICTVSRNGTASILVMETGDYKYPPARLSDSRFDRYTAGVGCDGEIVAAVSDDGYLRVYRFFEGLLWEKDLKTRVFGAPLITRGRLFSIGLDGRLLAFTLKKGRELWRYVSPLENLVRTPLDSALTVSGDTLYGGIDNGAIVALNWANGKTRWENTISLPGGSNEIANILDVTTPVVNGNTVCAAAYASGIACFDAASGERLWHYTLPAYTRVAFDDAGKRLFATDIDGTLYAFNAAGGDLLWQNKTGTLLSAPAAVNGLVLAGGDDGIVHAYFADDGAAAATLDLGTDQIISITPLPTAPDNALVLSLDGLLSRLRVEQ